MNIEEIFARLIAEKEYQIGDYMCAAVKSSILIRNPADEFDTVTVPHGFITPEMESQCLHAITAFLSAIAVGSPFLYAEEGTFYLSNNGSVFRPTVPRKVMFRHRPTKPLSLILLEMHRGNLNYDEFVLFRDQWQDHADFWCMEIYKNWPKRYQLVEAWQDREYEYERS